MRGCYVAAIAAFACAGSLGAQTPARWRLEAIATIEGPSEAEPFGVIRSIALRADGRVAVVDASAKRVSVYDASGKPLGYAGRIGSGPGETTQPYAVAWLSDTLAILDPFGSHIVFLTHGQVSPAQAIIQRLTGGNTVRFYPVSVTKAYTLASRRVGTELQSVFVGYSGRVPGDTIARPPFAAMPSGTDCKRPDGAIVFFTWPEGSRQLVVPARADGAIATAQSGEYRAALTSATGVQLASLTRAITPLPIPDSVWNAGIAEYNAFVSQYGAAACSRTPVRASHAAPLRAISIALDGAVWVTVRSTEGRTFDVFAPNGTLRAIIAAPPHIEDVPIAVAGDRVALVAETGDGAQVLKLYRIVR